ncbi:Translation initiation factor 3 subunit c [Hypoxylon texense]
MASNQAQLQMKKAGAGTVGRGKEGTTDEEQLELSMKQLNLLHVKCRELRTTLQHMLDTMPSSVSSDEMYARFLKSIGVAGGQIKDFSALYNSEESKKVLNQAKRSRDANPMGIKPWRAKDHPNWLDLD